jgi:hypothetical protein
MTLMLNSFVDGSAICCQNKVNDESKKKKKKKNNYVTCRALGSAENCTVMYFHADDRGEIKDSTSRGHLRHTSFKDSLNKSPDARSVL